jgi:chaperonin GroEL
LLSPQLLTDPVRHRADLENPAILISDLEVSHPNQLIPLVSAAIKAEIKTLVLVVTAIEDVGVGLLRDERTWSKIRVIPVKTPGAGLTDQMTHLEDLALLTGGQPILAVTKAKLENAKLAHLGRAWHAWASPDYFGVVGGKGEPAQVRRHVARLRQAASHSSDAGQRQKLQQRVGQLLGGAAVLSVGGITETEIRSTRATLERTAQAMRGAVADGILPGGGLALLACRPVLTERYHQSATPDERAAYGMLLRAIEEPLRTLAANAGYEPSAVMAQLNQAPPSYGFDARTGQVVELVTAGVFDIATTQKEAIRSAIAGAALALTIDTLVYSKKPTESMDP